MTLKNKYFDNKNKRLCICFKIYVGVVLIICANVLNTINKMEYKFNKEELNI